MKYAMPIMYFVFAAVGLWGATGSRFYGGGLGRKATHNPTPTWFGRAWFILFALGASYMGVRTVMAFYH